MAIVVDQPNEGRLCKLTGHTLTSAQTAPGKSHLWKNMRPPRRMQIQKHFGGLVSPGRA
jgi:hypothetical protein